MSGGPSQLRGGGVGVRRGSERGLALPSVAPSERGREFHGGCGAKRAVLREQLP